MLDVLFLCLGLACVLLMVLGLYRAGRKDVALIALRRPLLPVCVLAVNFI
jgi:hypothetical protein